MINGKWYGDSRVTSHIEPFCLNAKTYFTITRDNKIRLSTDKLIPADLIFGLVLIYLRSGCSSSCLTGKTAILSCPEAFTDWIQENNCLLNKEW